MNTWDYIERVRARNNGCSDYRIAQILGISKQSMSKYRSAGTPADDEIAAKIAVALDLPPMRVIADLRAGRAEAEGNKLMASVWHEALATFAAPPAPVLSLPQRASGGATAIVVPETKKRRAGVPGRRSVQSISDGMEKMVAGDGIEPPTRGFSIPCSTD